MKSQHQNKSLRNIDKISFAIPLQIFKGKIAHSVRMDLIRLATETALTSTPEKCEELLRKWAELYPDMIEFTKWQHAKALEEYRKRFPEKEVALPDVRCGNCGQAISLLPKSFPGDIFMCGRCGCPNHINRGV